MIIIKYYKNINHLLVINTFYKNNLKQLRIRRKQHIYYNNLNKLNE